MTCYVIWHNSRDKVTRHWNKGQQWRQHENCYLLDPVLRMRSSSFGFAESLLSIGTTQLGQADWCACPRQGHCSHIVATVAIPGHPRKLQDARQAVHYNITLRRVRVTAVNVEEQKVVTYSECVSVTLVIQHAKSIRSNALSSEASMALPYSPTLFHKRHDFLSKTKLLKIRCVFWSSLQLLSETFIVHRVTAINVHRSSRAVPVIIVRRLWHPNFIKKLSKNPQISNFMKIRPLRAKLCHVDGRMGRQTWRN